MDLSFLSEKDRADILKIAELKGISIEDIVALSLRECVRREERGDELRWQFPKMLPKNVPITMDEWCCCLSEDCPIRSECAQHSSAGDFRTDDGIRPMLVRLDFGDPDDTMAFGCCTYLEPRFQVGYGMLRKKTLTEATCGHIPR